MTQTVSHRRPNTAYPFLGEFRMCSVIVPSFGTLKRVQVALLLALCFHSALSAISVAEEPRITVYGASSCGPCQLMKRQLGLQPTSFGVKNVQGVDVNFINASGFTGQEREKLGIEFYPTISVEGKQNIVPRGLTRTQLGEQDWTVELLTEIAAEKKRQEAEQDNNSDTSDEEDGDESTPGHGEPEKEDDEEDDDDDGDDNEEPNPNPAPPPPPPPPAPAPAPPAPDGGQNNDMLGQMLGQALSKLMQGGGGQGSNQQQQSNQTDDWSTEADQLANSRIMEMVYATQTIASIETANARATAKSLTVEAEGAQPPTTDNQTPIDTDNSTESSPSDLVPTATPTPLVTSDSMIETI